jgi:hypothetical protein
MSKDIRRYFPEVFKREPVGRVRTSGLSVKAVAVGLGASALIKRPVINFLMLLA